MASWILVPCLVSLRNEFNALAPTRGKGSDGSIGDSAHASSSSDHNPDETGATPYEDSDDVNEVHAIDVDKDLNKSGWSMQKAVEIIITRHRTGQDNRLQNVIYDRRIWSRSWDWTAREYTGSNPHDKHAHFSARYTAAQEADTGAWGLLEAEEDEDMTISQEDFNARMDAWWNARLSPGAADNPQRRALRVAPWQQVVGRTEKSTHMVLFDEMYNMLVDAAAFDSNVVAPALGQLATTLAAARSDLLKGFADTAARDAQDAARDAGVVALLNGINQAVQDGTAVLDQEQFDQLRQEIVEKMIEAGQDAADRTNAKINEVAEGLNDAAEALANAIKEQPST